MIYTAMPVLALGTFDKDVEERMSLKFSKLYTPGQRNLFFTREKFAQSAIHGILTSLVLFGVTLGNEERVTLSVFSSHLSSPFFVQQFFILF